MTFPKLFTDVQFATTSKRYPHVRTGLLATNLVSPKVVDGIARLLVKADVERLRSKDKVPVIDKAEDTMAHRWDVAAKLVGEQHLTKEQSNPLLGRLHTRVILHITGKVCASILCLCIHMYPNMYNVKTYSTSTIGQGLKLKVTGSGLLIRIFRMCLSRASVFNTVAQCFWFQHQSLRLGVCGR